MKKEFVILFLAVFFLVSIVNISAATLCKNSYGYYEDCRKVQYYDGYENYSNYYNSNSNYISNYNSNYDYMMDSCRDSRGNYYPCYKEDYYYRDCESDDPSCNRYSNYYDYTNDRYRYSGYHTYSRSINYRDVYGNYVTEIRPDYTRRYCEDDWNLPWHLRSYSSCYDSYDPVYNNKYYPDYYINQNIQNAPNTNNEPVVIYVR